MNNDNYNYPGKVYLVFFDTTPGWGTFYPQPFFHFEDAEYYMRQNFMEGKIVEYTFDSASAVSVVPISPGEPLDIIDNVESSWLSSNKMSKTLMDMGRQVFDWAREHTHVKGEGEKGQCSCSGGCTHHGTVSKPPSAAEKNVVPKYQLKEILELTDKEHKEIYEIAKRKSKEVVDEVLAEVITDPKDP